MYFPEVNAVAEQLVVSMGEFSSGPAEAGGGATTTDAAHLSGLPRRRCVPGRLGRCLQCVVFLGAAPLEVI